MRALILVLVIIAFVAQTSGSLALAGVVVVPRMAVSV